MGLCLLIVAEPEIDGDERTVIYEDRDSWWTLLG